MNKTGWLALMAAVLAAPILQGCLPMAAVGVGAVVTSANDRRTSGTHIEDEGIELRASNRLSERWGDKIHVNVTSFNRSVLLTGEVSDEATKAAVEKMVSAVVNVRGITNDLAIAGVAALPARTNDAYLTSKVKARFVDAPTVNPFQVKVVTENSTVYLLGIVTEAEAKAATEIARTTGGVRRVVRLFEYCKVTDEVCRPSDPAKSGGAKAQAKP
ncbi:MAG: BON domain-containing protein [Betaproteobacteria bacterium]|nr:BON domain-containing protein [Betaproteobacteria bacterium]